MKANKFQNKRQGRNIGMKMWQNRTEHSTDLEMLAEEGEYYNL